MTERQAVRWERFRQKGKWPYVLVTATVFAVFQLLAATLLDWFWSDPIQLPAIRVILSVIGGFVVSHVLWWSGEARYQNYLLDKNIRDRIRT